MHTRRAVLGKAAQIVGAGALAAALRPPWVHAAGDEVIRLGLIGCGGRGCGAARNALDASPAVKLVAVGDLFEDRVKSARLMLGRGDGGRVDIKDQDCFVGFEACAGVLQAGVDAVILTTPPGFRPRQFEAAVRAGKHVFLEKPVAVDSPGARRVMTAAEQARLKGLKVAVGFQRRHDPRYIESIKRLRDGAMGAVTKLEASWKADGIWARARQAGMTEMEYQVRNWIHFVWLSGDMIVEVHTHNLDVCNWLKGGHPEKASGNGAQRLNGANRGDTFDRFAIKFTHADGTDLLSECGYGFKGAEMRVGEWAETTKGKVSIAAVPGLGGVAAKNPYQQEMVDLFTAILENKAINEAPRRPRHP